MTNKTFEDHRSIDFTDHLGRSVEFYMFENGQMHIDAMEGSENACCVMTAEDATALKEFLIKRGY